jgi:hypothetical protein
VFCYFFSEPPEFGMKISGTAGKSKWDRLSERTGVGLVEQNRTA